MRRKISKLGSKTKYLSSWHAWFAWHPVRVINGETHDYRVWLEPVKRKGTFNASIEDSYWTWEYRL